MTTTTTRHIDCDGTRLSNCYFVTVGCAKNETDTDRMRALLLKAGYGEVLAPEEADVIIVNTCSFLGIATQESVETTLSLAQVTRENTDARIVMCGCVPSRYGNDLIEELPEVDAFVASDEEDGIVRVVSSLLGNEVQCAPSSNEALRTIESASAYVKISEGCDRWCAFCAIPLIRGPYESRPAEDILLEVRTLMEGGVREVVLVGQDTGVWGQDLEGERNLAWLLTEVSNVVRPYDGWVRVLYLQPEGMSSDLVDVVAGDNCVLPYIDIPIQHSVAHVLSDMGRSGSPEELQRLFSSLRERIPNVVLRTTGLVGFPGETEEDFEDLCGFVDMVGFDYVSVFPFSPEEGTRAETLPNQVDEALRVERAQELQDIAERLGFAATARRVGQSAKVIIEGVEEVENGTELVGHAWFQAPDCDGAVHIQSGEASVGDIVTCRFTDAFCYELIGTIEDDASRLGE